MSDYRLLSVSEIDCLQRQGCRAEDWSLIRVKEGFRPECVENVRFYGPIRLGVFAGQHTTAEGLTRPSGIRNAELHDVCVDDNVLLENIGSYVAHYDIGSGASVSNVGCMAADGRTGFGVGGTVQVLSESGARYRIRQHPMLSAQEVMLRWSLLDEVPANGLPTVNQVMDEWIQREADAWTCRRAEIGACARIRNVRQITNTYIGPCACIDGAESLLDCCLLSREGSPVVLANGSLCVRSVLVDGASVLDGAKVYDTFVGQHVHVGKGCSVEQSLLFANTYLDNGEACAVCAGPFTVSHHKSTLLIGCRGAFMNAGSGTNMSNHMYKMGPVHQGTLRRGCKTASGTHLVWPGVLGDFSMVMGKCDAHADLADFPFSYVFGERGEVQVIPGVNFGTLGTYRDIRKWPLRDNRPPQLPRLDSISTYDALNPCTIEAVRAGRRRLETFLAGSTEGDGAFRAPGMRITRTNARRGVELYRLIEEMYVAQHAGRLDNWPEPLRQPETSAWVDWLGLILSPQNRNALANGIRYRSIASFEELVSTFSGYAGAYPALCQEHIRQTYTRHETIQALQHQENNLDRYYTMVEADLSKELLLMGDGTFHEVEKMRKSLQNDRQEALNKAKQRLSFLLGAAQV